MTKSWASSPTDMPAEEFLQAIRVAIPVSTISTARSLLVTLPNDCPSSVFSEAKYEPYDFIPVTKGDEIVGVYEKSANGRVFLPLTESILIESDSSLMEFVAHADERPLALLVKERQIVGLVTHADLQKLPVYTVAFAMASVVEMQLMAWIRETTKRSHPGDEDAWMKYVDNRQTIENHYQSSKKANVAIDKLSCASFSEEVDAAVGLGLISDREPELRKLIQLRNAVCHGKEIALVKERVEVLSSTIRSAGDLAIYISDKRKVKDK